MPEATVPPPEVPVPGVPVLGVPVPGVPVLGVPVLGGMVGQEGAVRQLRAAARAPVHAYLFVGPPGGGKRRAARAFAAALLCPEGGCGQCSACTRALAEVHPDLLVVEREGAYISIGQAREIQRLALRTPNEARRKVLVLEDFHLVREAAPTLLKVIEEPPESAVFVVLAEYVAPELVTIASRCVTIEFGALGVADIVSALAVEGVDASVAARAAEAAGGRLDRARLLASDSGFEARRDRWRAVPSRLDGSGAAVAREAASLTELLATAAVAPLEARQAAEVAALEERVALSGERGSGRRQLADRHKRELRRLRAEELRFGLAVLAGAYRDALVDGRTGADGRACRGAVEAIQAAAEAIVRNPNESLLLQSLLLQLPPLREPSTTVAPTPG